MTADKEFEELFGQHALASEEWQAARAIDAKGYKTLVNDSVSRATWQVARAIDANRIAELEAQNKAMREVLQAYSENKKIGLAATCLLAKLDKEG